MTDPEPPTSRGAAAFFQHEAAGGIVMMIAAVIALVVSNSPLAGAYQALLDLPVSIRAGQLALDKPLLHWINDGLMAVFFCLVALEIKRELLVGELSSRAQALLPLVAAIGGMAVPAAIYVAINAGDAAALDGWAIPTATDIAFAVAVLSLLGPGVPASLKVFLLALAIIDDLGAIVIIAIFYTSKLSLLALVLAGIGVAGLAVLNLRGVTRIAPYMLVGFAVWVCVLKSGIHATLAGVLVGLAIPMRGAQPNGDTSPLEHLEHQLHPWVSFAVLPLFGFANAGVELTGLTLGDLGHNVTLGVALGLLLGKPIGILGACWLAQRAGLCPLPAGATWPQMAGVAMLAGIGFTMSLFIGILAFADPAFSTPVRLGVLLGSLLAAGIGYSVLRRACGATAPPSSERQP